MKTEVYSEALIPEAVLPTDFYQGDDVIALSRALLGKYLFAKAADGSISGGIIVETEAYAGASDRACHAFQNRKTPRTQVMYEAGGVAYVYLCYGIHSLLNIVLDEKNVPNVALIRAIEPIFGVEKMCERRNLIKPDYRLTAGPGALTRALGVDLSFNGEPLTGPRIWLAESGLAYLDSEIIESPRVGIGYAGEHVDLPWRFRVKDNRWTSRAK